MTWPDGFDTSPVGPDFLGPLTPKEVLYELEGPCIFTAEAPSMGLLLAYLVEELEEDDLLRYLVCSTTEAVIEDLRSGQTDVRSALSNGWLWVADLNANLEPQEVYRVTKEHLPEDALPERGTMLYAELEPALKVRFVGESLRKGSVPAHVYAQAGDIVRALKSIFEHTLKPLLQEGVGGRPSNQLRELYNLPTQRIAYGSLEISFRAPTIVTMQQPQLDLEGVEQPPSLESLVDKGWELLRKGLEWAIQEDDDGYEAEDDEEMGAILEGLKRLAPSLRGPVTSIEISGASVSAGRGPFPVSRDTARKVRKHLTQFKQERVVRLQVFRGQVRDLDLDQLTFIVRNIPGQPPDAEVPFVMDDDRFLETVQEAHYRGLEVEIAARSKDRRIWTVVEVEYTGEEEREPDQPEFEEE